MLRTLFIITTLFFNSILISCSNKEIKNDDYHAYLSQIYYQAKKELKEKNFISAIKKLEIICKQYSFSKYYEDAKLNLIHAYYQNGDFEISRNLIKEFIQKNPDYSNMDYIIYLKGIINMNINGSKIQKILKIDLSDKDISYSNEAFDDFLKILTYYKNSKYINDCKKNLASLKKLLSLNELKIINFYIKKEAYITVINRIIDMLEKYPDSKSTFIALSYLKKMHKKNFLSHEFDKISNIINNTII